MSEANDTEKDGDPQRDDAAPVSDSPASDAGSASAPSERAEAQSDEAKPEAERAKAQSDEAKPEAERAEAQSDEAKPEAERAEAPALSNDAPVRKKKKKKKKKGDAEAKKQGPEYDVSGAERAAFLAWFPEDPDLDRLVRAFEVGNYAYVREHAGKLAEQSKDEKVRVAARELLARIEPDPLMKVLLAGAVLLLFFLTLYAFRSHGH